MKTHSVDYNNYVESSFRETRDHQFNRTKCFNIPELLSVVMDHSERYKHKLIDLGCNRTAQLRYNNSHYRDIHSKINDSQIIDLGQGIFLVESESTHDRVYRVNMITGLCQCPKGLNCGPCKHKSAVARIRSQAEFSVLPLNDPHMKALWHYIAIGQTQPNHMYRGINDPTDLIIDVKGFLREKLRGSRHRE